MKSLLIGCGNTRAKNLGEGGWGELVTLDIDPSTGCDIVHDLEVLPYPMDDNDFDEIHAYEVLEHCGRQGDWRFYFGQFSEFHRILKPGGRLYGTCPSVKSPWLWGDPGHTRAITVECLNFLSQGMYEQVGKTACTDYRHVWKGDFEIEGLTDDGTSLMFCLKRAA